MTTLDQLHDLGDSASVLQQQWEEIDRRRTPATGTDESETITAHVDADGRFAGVSVAVSWRDHHAPEGLAVAVREAVTAAKTAHLEQWAEIAEGVDDEPAPQRRPTMSADILTDNLEQLGAGTGATPDQVGAVCQELLEGLLEKVEGIDSLLEQQLHADHVGRSGARHVRATVGGGGELRELQIDLRWLDRAHEVNLGREITQSVQAALAEQAKHSARALYDAHGLGAIARLTTDPGAAQEILRRR